MRKSYNSIIALFFIIITIASIFSLYIPKSMASSEDALIIPNEAIRLRILANSDSEEDQKIKRLVRDRVNEQISIWVRDLASLEDARKIITSNLDEIEKIAAEVLEEQGVNQSLQVEFNEVSFPTKLYGNFLYPAGIYEAILITIGEGNGANWWCVLFPPLCFLDFSSGSAVSTEGFEDDETAAPQTDDEEETKTTETEQVFVEEEEEEVEVKFFIVEIINKIASIFN